MISRITGKVSEKGANCLILDLGGLSYEVFIPACVMSGLDTAMSADGKISLLTYHYYQVDQAKSIPILIGFLTKVEKDFFEIFITVSGIGPRAALKALNKPISLIAKAIDEGDLPFLKSLPGIGEQRAKEIVAKLQNKVGKFGLIQDRDTQAQCGDEPQVRHESHLNGLARELRDTDDAGDVLRHATLREEGHRKTLEAKDRLLGEHPSFAKRQE